MSKAENFFWGASTAAHQVEGAAENQWSVWELSVAKEQAKTAKTRLGWLKNYDNIKGDATNPSNYVSGKGIDHYNLYKQDFAIAKKMGLNAFRFTLEWSRIEPEQGKWNHEALQHYREYINELNKLGIEPFLNIWHWTLPVWFADKGGFAKRANIKYFEEFVTKVAYELLGRVNYVITLNEPNVYIGMSYSDGNWPPNEKNKLKAFWVYNNLKIAHIKAYNIIKKQHPRIQIGVAQQLANIQAYRPENFYDESVVKIMRYFWNWWWLNRTKKQQDFIGFNYYFTDYYKGFQKINPQKPVNDLGWYMNPSGILPLLQRIAYHYPGKPIIVTENGVADSKDEFRQWWLKETITAIETAKSQKVPIIGYLHWSLLDNFEWAYGWWPKFGLVAVDREQGMKRTVRPSGLWFAKEIAKRKV